MVVMAGSRGVGGGRRVDLKRWTEEDGEEEAGGRKLHARPQRLVLPLVPVPMPLPLLQLPLLLLLVFSFPTSSSSPSPYPLPPPLPPS